MSDELLTSLLRDVSRSFYLTMRMLPGAVRRQISLAYLLARTTDTIADTELVEVPLRLQALAALRERILGRNNTPLPLTQLQVGQELPGERILLERCEDSLRLLLDLEEADRRLVRDVLDIIISGQTLDLQRFGAATADQIVALQTGQELDDYTYRVAGCVGEFWTRICAAHLWARSEQKGESLTRLGVRFGKGLQLVNILRDLPRDLRKGRCYVPWQSLTAAGLTPKDLLSARNEARFRPAYDPLLALAEGHLAAGWEYTGSLPKRQVRLRLGCAWPVLIGARTLRKLRHENMLDAARRVKVSRPEVRSLILRSVFLYPFARSWDAQFGKEMELISSPV
ncbi:MAG TPA: phytoene/squalene synthase family protein [Candidatus Cybelea sp.]|nr:phytoene/squalene synthase family protein [Candidatus Cybelea sp.]